MSDEPSPKIATYYYRHRLTYWLAMAALVLANVVVGGGWWTFWPMFIWSVALSFHYCTFKCLVVDREWARDKAMDLQAKSYDFGHIQDMGQRIKDDHYSTRPTDDRERD